MRRRDWVDPAPLEISRPRVPWWTLGPKWVLVAIAPVLATVAAVWLLIHIGRRLYRYPVLIALGALLAAVYLQWRVVGVLLLALAITAVVVAWALGHPASFERFGWRQVRSEYRRLWVYAFRWHRVMVFSELAKTVKTKTYTPSLVRVRCDGWRDRVTVRLLAGQAPVHYEQRAEALAHSFGALSCRVRVLKPRRIVLDLVHADPLAAPIPAPALAPVGTAVDLKRLTIGRTETGRPARLRLLGNQVLVVGIDPKGGMELGKASALFHRLVCTNGTDAVALLEHVATLTRQRAAGLRQTGRRKWTPGHGSPFVLLVVDELADLIAYQPDRKLRERANLAIQTIVSQGRAPGVAVLGQVQDPRKTVVDFRHLFPTRLALRLDEPAQVDMVLGDGVRQRGANAHEIPESTPGVAWVKQDGKREPVRVRAFHVTDTNLDALSTYVTAGTRRRGWPPFGNCRPAPRGAEWTAQLMLTS